MQRALAALLPEGEQSKRLAQVELSSSDDAVAIKLTNADGVVEAQKLVKVRPSCEGAAEQVAIIIALWDAELDSGLSLALPDTGLPERAEVVPEPRLSVRTQALPAVSPPSAWLGQAGLGLLLTRSGGSFAPAVEGSLRLYSRAVNAGVVTSVVWVDEHTHSFPAASNAEVSWRQLWIGVGPSLRFATAAINLVADLQFNTGLTFARGSGFDKNASGKALELGARAGLAVSYGRGRWRPWFGVSTAFRGRQQDVYAEGLDVVRHRLPLFEFLLGGGVLFAWAL